MSNQSNLGSILEACLNTFIGWFVALITQLVVFPLFDINISINENLGISFIFTGISVIRSYVVRRIGSAYIK